MTLAPPRARWRATASAFAVCSVLLAGCGALPDASGAAGQLTAPQQAAQPTPTTATYEAESNPAWTYAGTWGASSTERYSSQSGATATLRIPAGTQLQWYATRDDHHGIATISIDGGPAVDVDLYRAGRAVNQLVYTSPVLADGPHTVVITDTNRSNPAADDVANPTVIDRMVVTLAVAEPPPTTTTSAPEPTTAPPSSTTVPPSSTTAPPPPPPATPVTYEGERGAPWTFGGTWYPGTVDTHTRAAGATATLPFTGTSVELYGVKDAHHGIATVSVDGGPAVDVDQYSATRVASAVIFSSGPLADGNHTLVITKTDRRNPAARVETNGNAWSLDKAIVNGTATPPPTTTTPAPPTSTTTPVPPPTTTTPAPVPGGQPLITRQGQNLLRNGVEWKFAGVNLDAIFGCWTGERDWATPANLDRFFAELHDNTLTRVWVYRNDASHREMLSRVVAAAERHDQYLMVTLSDGNNSGTQCGSLKGSSYPADGGPVLAHARALVPDYADSPAIAFWEIINEGSNDPPAAPWYRTIGLEIKRMDPNTLVVGGAGTCWNGTDVSTCQPTSDSEWNDMINVHEYDWNDGRVTHHSQNAQVLADREGLPWFSGESGFCCNGGRAGLTEAQAAVDLATEWRSYLAPEDSAGMLYWTAKGVRDPGPATITPFQDQSWQTARTFTHQWQGE